MSIQQFDFNQAVLKAQLLNQMQVTPDFRIMNGDDTIEIQDLAQISAQDNSYFSSKQYLAQSAADKMDDLWAQLSENQASGSWPTAALIFTESMNTTFDAKGDAMPNTLFSTRTKYIHSVGTVGKVKLVSSGQHPFSGIFQGADYGIVRLSSAAKPAVDGSQPLAPGMGLKFLRNGIDSANLVAMFSVDGQPGDWNFFSNDFSNHIPTPKSSFTGDLLAKKFATATPFIQEVGLEDFSRLSQDGLEAEGLTMPFLLRFEPHSDVKNLFPVDAPSDPMAYIEQLKSVPANSTLYKVYGMTAPKELGGTEVYIGDLVLEGNLITSKWGDENLFIRHERLEEDLKVHSDWTKYEAKWSASACPFLSKMAGSFIF